MSELVEKARLGRMNALASLSANARRGSLVLGQDARVSSSARHEVATFSSVRARMAGNIPNC